MVFGDQIKGEKPCSLWRRPNAGHGSDSAHQPASCGGVTYWQALCPLAELTDEKPGKPLRLLGEDLAVFTDGQGRYGLVEARRHRRVSLVRGLVEDGGIRCACHGRKYATDGRCLSSRRTVASRMACGCAPTRCRRSVGWCLVIWAWGRRHCCRAGNGYGYVGTVELTWAWARPVSPPKIPIRAFPRRGPPARSAP
ncbi:Rieske 2Fe-2S domain-containing protein [Immundisolibacter sp.]